MNHDDCRCDLLTDDQLDLADGWRIGTAVRHDGSTSVWLIDPSHNQPHTHKPATPPQIRCGRRTASGTACQIPTSQGRPCHWHRTTKRTALGRAADRLMRDDD